MEIWLLLLFLDDILAGILTTMIFVSVCEQNLVGLAAIGNVWMYSGCFFAFGFEVLILVIALTYLFIKRAKANLLK